MSNEDILKEEKNEIERVKKEISEDHPSGIESNEEKKTKIINEEAREIGNGVVELVKEPLIINETDVLKID